MKRLLTDFFKDHIPFITTYFCGCFFIILFYHLFTKGKIEIFYPVLISAFVFLIFLIFRWFQYYRFSQGLLKAVKNKDYDLSPSTCEQAASQQAINAIHKQYLEAIEETRQVNMNKDRLISGWVHNMKTPISVISLILQKENIGAEDLQNIKEENGNLLNLLEQILILFRLNNFSKDYTPEPTDLEASLKNVINSKKNQFIYNHIFPKFDTAGSVIVLTDPKWNEIMIGQFISNAIKYSADFEKSKNIWFEINRQNGRVVLIIRDEGMGIPKYDLNRIFDPFFTGENGRKVKNSSGIGLYMCAEIAKKLGHQIDISSEQGNGTVVSISYLSKL